MTTNSLNKHIWKYFLIFSIIILGFLWVFQGLFLDSYYKYGKINDIKKVADIVKFYQNSKSFSNVVNNASYDRSVCVEVIDRYYGTLYNSSFLGKGCFTGKEKNTKYKYDFINSGKDNGTYELVNPEYNNETLVFAVKLNGGRYAFINTSLEPIDSTISLLRGQLIVITIIIILLSFILSYFISNMISSPIVKMNNSAKRLAKGDFNVEFDIDTKISELNELSNTLNYTKSELSKTEELRRDLMANVSHDLKTPLTMIKAYAEMGRDLHKDNKKKRDNDMDTIINEVDRLTLLVNDILELSKMQSNTDVVNITKFNLIDLINEIINRYSVYSELEDYKFIFNYDNSSVMINADYKKVEQVIYNLINNAINYTGEDNTVVVNVKDSNTIRVEIIDSGKGIKEEDIPYIWDRYYKNSKKHKRNLIGTGLGLSIVKNILELHNYKYGVISSSNGTTFYFEIKKESN